MKLKAAALFVFGVTSVLSGCNGQTPTPAKPLRMEYDSQYEKVIPRLDPGDQVMFNVAIDWKFGSPCVPGTDPRSCTIRPRGELTGKIYSFKCTEIECDPEIAVDDTRDTTTSGLTAVVAAGSALVRIEFGCEPQDANGLLQAVPEEARPSRGDRIKWVNPGAYPVKEWQITVPADAYLETILEAL